MNSLNIIQSSLIAEEEKTDSIWSNIDYLSLELFSMLSIFLEYLQWTQIELVIMHTMHCIVHYVLLKILSIIIIGSTWISNRIINIWNFLLLGK